MTGQDILDILRQHGPQTGGQLQERTRLEALSLWRTAQRTPGVRIEPAGRRFLRLDREVEGYARFSPSIRREFLTYTVLGAEEQSAALSERARDLREEIGRISRAKFDLARETIDSVVRSLPRREAFEGRVCFLIAGDVIYGMAHAVPRPETSTGRMVRGSDLDIIAVADDGVPAEALRELDEAIFDRKHYLLVHPAYQEEIDYVVKNVSKVRRQLAFDTFRHMIAGKILHEGLLLYGSPAVFRTVKEMVSGSGVPGKIALLERRAAARRAEAEKALLEGDPGRDDRAFQGLFYTIEEGDEIC